MNSAARDLAHYLATQGVGIVAYSAEDRWCISYGREPATPRNALTVYDTGGLGPDTDEMNLYRSSIQVRVRSVGYDEGYAKLFQAMTLLNAISGLVIDLTSYVGVTTTTDITPIGLSENGLFLFTVNFDVIRE